EALEQLRFLENGTKIKMSRGEGSEMAVDTPEQADAVRSILAGRAV
ncbi:MAG: 3-deoxy-manno-octulosonate cytidylyltransferase, partial [Armatimonadetes bacterium]|nr:3-deoxy-manno-octulosonate cytidylyltransferase [Armatimonadota bacterium]